MHYPGSRMPKSDSFIPLASPQAPSARPGSVREFCERILLCGDLDSKLASPTSTHDHPLTDDPGEAPVRIDRPTRNPGLRMSAGSNRLPRPGLLTDPAARIECLSRFAHHELMAVELFAWALLRRPRPDRPLRKGLLAALVDEQNHCRLYLDRLAAHGGRFDTDDHSDYFWQQIPHIAASPHGSRAFLSAMGLTLEQANLDFTLTYRDGFADAGDVESAAVCQRVHDEEIAHVALAVRWMQRLDPDTEPKTDLEGYLDCVPFPLGPARAKGRRFEVGARRKAGLSEEMIEFIRLARSPQEHRPTRRDANKATR